MQLSEINHFDPPTAGHRFNLAAHVLGESTARFLDRNALQIVRLTGAERWSYQRLSDTVAATATGLLERGLVPGDRVLLRLGNTVDFPVAFLGAIHAGLVPVVTSSLLTQSEITPMAARIQPKLIIAADGIALPTEPFPVLPLAEFVKMTMKPRAEAHLGDPNRPAYIIFTSGTTGSPMAVVHAHRAILARQMMHQGWEDLGAGDRLMHAGAFNWTYTLGTGLMDPWTVGATALIPDHGITPDQLPLLLGRFDATIFAAAPGVYRQILRNRINPLPRLRHGLSAGEKLSDDIRAAWTAATGTPIYEALGMSEVSTFISGSRMRPAPVGTAGFAQPGRRIAALGPDCTPVPRGEPGQLAVDRRDPGLMIEYLDAPEATAARFQGDWFLTGDLVSIGEDGAVVYLGRNDDQINAGGFRVSPVEIENAMQKFPQITDAAACEIEVKPGVTVIALFYTAATDLDQDQLAAHATQHLARYKQPRVYHRLDALPRTANAKLNRRLLKDFKPK